MTTMKKLVSLVLAILMLCACVAANAATITIQNGNENSQYNIYKLLDVTVSEDGKNYSYSLNDTYAEVLKAVLGDDPIATLQGLSSESEELYDKGQQIYTKIKEAGISATATVTGNAVSDDVGKGYVLVVETALGDSEDTYSLHMLDTAQGENITVTTKEAVPTLEKKLKETNDTTGVVTDWQDGADYDVDDEIPFKLTGTLSSEYDHYKTYYYEFVDTMDDGLTFIPGSVKVYVDNGDGTEPVDVTASFVTTNTDDHNFTVVCEDLKMIENADIDFESKIVVEYSAKLNSDCVLAPEGNENKAMLKYNNNPYYDGDGVDGSDENTSETPWDQVAVFTYKLDVTKVDSEMNELTGASFALYKKEMIDGAVQEVLIAEIDGTDTSNFVFERLDAGDYIIKETDTPDGYNPIADIAFTITAEYETVDDEPEFIKLETNNNDMTVTDGTISTSIVNQSGQELPTTGGIGTTIFYVVGGVLVLLAVVLLVTKRRVGEN